MRNHQRRYLAALLVEIQGLLIGPPMRVTWLPSAEVWPRGGHALLWLRTRLPSPPTGRLASGKGCSAYAASTSGSKRLCVFQTRATLDAVDVAPSACPELVWPD